MTLDFAKTDDDRPGEPLPTPEPKTNPIPDRPNPKPVPDTPPPPKPPIEDPKPPEVDW